MRHQCAAAIGLFAVALLAPVTPSDAASADPTGFWKKPDAERDSKIEVFKCGKNKANLCAKIAWLKDPNDSKGQPLHDVRNENPALRGRPIMGLPIFTDLVPSAPSTWNGKIYNPEDGRTYTATLTVVSRRQILLKGCKAWLLCGERNWFRTTAPEVVVPAAPAEGEQQIEASATPPAPASATAAAEPVAVRSADEAVAAASTAPAAPKEMQAAVAPQLPAVPSQEEEAELVPVAAPAQAMPVTQQMAAPTEPPADVNAGGGYGFLAVSSDPSAKAPQSGEDVSSMMLMAKPIAAETAATPAAQPAAKAPLPEPKAQPKPPVATAAAKPAMKPVTAAAATPAAKPVATAAARPTAAPAAKPVTTAAATTAAKPGTHGEAAEQGAPPPPEGDLAAADGTDAAAAETADASVVEPVPLTRRERRMLRKQQREYERAQQDPLLPWLAR